MARKIVVCSQKGGVGKTTTVVNLAVALARRGCRVLLIDSDAQADSTLTLGFDKRSLDSSLYDLMLGAERDPNKIIRKTNQASLWLLPACSRLTSAEIELVHVMGREFILKEKISQVENQFDYILVDCSPGIHLLSINAMFLCDEIIIPVQSQFYALEGLDQLFYTLNMIKTRMEHDIKVAGLLCTMYDKRNRLSPAILSELHALFGSYLFTTLISVNTTLAEAPIKNGSIFDYAPRSRGAVDYSNLCKEVMDRHVGNQIADYRYVQDVVANVEVLDCGKGQLPSFSKTIAALRPLVDQVLPNRGVSLPESRHDDRRNPAAEQTLVSQRLHQRVDASSAEIESELTANH